MIKKSSCRSPGRPKKSEADARESLIEAARLCFSINPYAKVTTRMVAQQAGVNAALIRYYFVNKEGLYQQMLTSVAELFQNKVSEYFNDSPDNPFEAILKAHRALADKNPDIPKLIFKELAFNEGKGRQMVLDSVAKPNRAFMLALLHSIDSNTKKNKLREDFEPSILMFSVLSVSLMPMLLQKAIEAVEGQKMTAQRLEKMLWQNAQMLQFGCLVRDNEVSSDD